MGDFASRTVAAWNERRKASAIAAGRGLVALAFDQRNHGTRLVSEIANRSWKAGNETHAIDMMGAIRGMVEDTRGLMDVVEGYLGCAGAEGAVVDGHYVMGRSLGGHSAWQLMFGDERVTAGVIVIGCPDYMGESPFLSPGVVIGMKVGRGKEGDEPDADMGEDSATFGPRTTHCSGYL